MNTFVQEQFADQSWDMLLSKEPAQEEPVSCPDVQEDGPSRPGWTHAMEWDTARFHNFPRGYYAHRKISARGICDKLLYLGSLKIVAFWMANAGRDFASFTVYRSATLDEDGVFFFKCNIGPKRYRRIFRTTARDPTPWVTPLNPDLVDDANFDCEKPPVFISAHGASRCKIVIQRRFHDKPELYEWLMDPNGEHAFFDNKCDADAWIESNKNRSYCSASHECPPPRYIVVNEEKRPIVGFHERILEDDSLLYVWLRVTEWSIQPRKHGSYIAGIQDGEIVEFMKIRSSLKPHRISPEIKGEVTRFMSKFSECWLGFVNPRTSGCNRFFPVRSLASEDLDETGSAGDDGIDYC